MKAEAVSPSCYCGTSRFRLRIRVFSILCLVGLAISSAPLRAETLQPLLLTDVLESVTGKYPPYLAALIERDVASGRYRSALGAMDLQTYLRIFNKPSGFYQTTEAEIGFEQFTNFRGATVFGGYQYTDGFLPDYYRSRRTDGGGTPSLGFRLPLLRDGSIDPRRAKIYKADLDKKLVDPQIQNQQLQFSLAAMKSYFHWLAAGRKLAITESLLEIAQKREEAIETQIESGLAAPVTALENRQLVVSRNIATTKARRQFQAAAITLSLFYRDAKDGPLLVPTSRLPKGFPPPQQPPSRTLSLALQHATTERPEIRLYELELENLNIDTRLLRNQLNPYLNAYVTGKQGLGNRLYKDTGELELELGIEFKMSLQRNQAKGNLQVNKAKIEQLQLRAKFVVNQITSDVWDSHSAVKATWEQLQQASLHVNLANQLHDIERDRFSLGAVNFLSLQLREQSAYQAQLDEVEVLQQYYEALSRLITATGIDSRSLISERTTHLIDMILSL